MTDRTLQGLRLIESGHYHGLGEHWLRKTGGAGAAEIERLRAVLERIVKADQREKSTCIAFDGAGGTYEITMIDGPLACIARAALNIHKRPE